MLKDIAMRDLFYLTFLLFITLPLHAQVGIGTTNPSPSSMLDINSTADGGITYKGFLLPRVPTVADRDDITPDPINDVGMLVFVQDIGSLQIWNGSGWESIHTINNTAFVNQFQNFDLNTSWGYTSDVAFWDNGAQGYFGVTNSANGGFSNITTLTNDFLGILDLNDTESGNGTAGDATITFNTIDVSAASSGVTVSFNYEFYEYDGGDDAYYTLIIDGVAQAEQTLINGVNGGGTGSGVSLSGTISDFVPAGTLTVALEIRISQNGQGDYAGFDNFSVVAN